MPTNPPCSHSPREGWWPGFGRLATLLVAASVVVVARPAHAIETPDHSATVLLIDASGSLKKTDPLRLRVEAASLFIATALDGDRIALVEFGGGASDLTDGFVPVDSTTRARLLTGARGVGDRLAYTDHAAALEHAAALFGSLDQAFRSQYRSSVVLFTDGLFDPDPSLSPSRAQLGDALAPTLRRLRDLHVRLFVMGLGPALDTEVLSRAANDLGGGVYTAQQPIDLVKRFWSLRLRLGGMLEIPAAPTGGGAAEFAEPAWAKRALLLEMSAQRGGLPSSSPRDPARRALFSGDFSRVSAIEAPGPRQILADPGRGGATSEARVAVMGDIVPVIRFTPDEIVKGETVHAVFAIENDGKPISTSTSFGDATALLRIDDFEQPLYDDGHRGDVAAGDGAFERDFQWPSSGRSRVTAHLEGGSVSFEAARDVEVLDRPFALEPIHQKLTCGPLDSCQLRWTLTNSFRTRQLPVEVRTPDGAVTQHSLGPSASEVVTITAPAHGTDFQLRAQAHGFEQSFEATVTLDMLGWSAWLRRHPLAVAFGAAAIAALIGIAARAVRPLPLTGLLAFRVREDTALEWEHSVQLRDLQASTATTRMLRVPGDFIIRSRRPRGVDFLPGKWTASVVRPIEFQVTGRRALQPGHVIAVTSPDGRTRVELELQA